MSCSYDTMHTSHPVPSSVSPLRSRLPNPRELPRDNPRPSHPVSPVPSPAANLPSNPRTNPHACHLPSLAASRRRSHLPSQVANQVASRPSNLHAYLPPNLRTSRRNSRHPSHRNIPPCSRLCSRHQLRLGLWHQPREGKAPVRKGQGSRKERMTRVWRRRGKEVAMEWHGSGKVVAR